MNVKKKHPPDRGNIGEREDYMKKFEEMTMEELLDLQKSIKEEIANRKGITTVYHVYKHHCYNESNRHLARYKHWAKLVKAVDTTKSNGYAFAGDFLSVNREARVPEGAVIVECCDTDLTCYKAGKDGFEKIADNSEIGTCAFIDKVAELFA